MSGACKLIDIPISQFYYESKKDDSEVIEALQELAFKHPSMGLGSSLLIYVEMVNFGTKSACLGFISS